MAIDADGELVTAVSVTPGNVADSQMLGPLIDPHAREVTADKGYDTDANHQRLKEGGQRSSIIIKDNRSNLEVIGQANPASQRERPNIERKFAEQGTPLKLRPSCKGGKKYHGLGKVRYRGLAKVAIQMLMTCIVVNCKKIAKPVSNRLSKLPVRITWAYT